MVRGRIAKGGRVVNAKRLPALRRRGSLRRRGLGSHAMLRALLLALLSLPAAAWATTVLRADVPALTRLSDAVVRGRVVSLQSHWTGDGLRIVTDVRLEVTEALKGAPAHTITIRQPGGTVGNIGQRVSGLASFKAGEEVVVFLERRGPVHVVTGLAQGKFHLDRLKDGRVRATPDDSGDARVVDPKTRAPLTPDRAPRSLERLRAQVREALRAQPRSSPR